MTLLWLILFFLRYTYTYLTSFSQFQQNLSFSQRYNVTLAPGPIAHLIVVHSRLFKAQICLLCWRLRGCFFKKILALCLMSSLPPCCLLRLWDKFSTTPTEVQCLHHSREKQRGVAPWRHRLFLSSLLSTSVFSFFSSLSYFTDCLHVSHLFTLYFIATHEVWALFSLSLALWESGGHLRIWA